MTMEEQPKGTAAAVVILLGQNPKWNHKHVARVLHVSLRRVQQITHRFGGLIKR